MDVSRNISVAFSTNNLFHSFQMKLFSKILFYFLYKCHMLFLCSWRLRAWSQNKKKIDLKSADFGDSAGSSPDLTWPWFGRNSLIFRISLSQRFITQFFREKINPIRISAIYDKKSFTGFFFFF